MRRRSLRDIKINLFVSGIINNYRLKKMDMRNNRNKYEFFFFVRSLGF